MLSANIQQFVDGVRRSVRIGAHWSSFHECWCEKTCKLLALHWSSSYKNFCLISKSSWITSAFNKIQAPAHRVQKTVDLLKRLTPDFIPSSRRYCGLQTVQTSTRSITRYGAAKSKMWMSCDKWKRLDRQRGQAVVSVAAKGGHFKQTCQYFFSCPATFISFIFVKYDSQRYIFSQSIALWNKFKLLTFLR